MDANAISSIISTLGFPIVCCAALFWYINKTQKDFTDKIEKTIESLNSSINDMNSTISQLTTTVSILHKIEGDDNG